MTAIELLEKLLKNTVRLQNAHFYTASMYFHLHTWLGLPSAVLAGIVSSAIFGTLGDNSLIWVRVTAGILSLLSAGMISAVTFLRFAEKGEQHRAAGIKYAELKRNAELLLAFPKDDLQTELINLTQKNDSVTTESPIIPDRVWSKFKDKVV